MANEQQSERDILYFTEEGRAYDFAENLWYCDTSDILLVCDEEMARAAMEAARAIGKRFQIACLCSISDSAVVITEGELRDQNAQVIGRMYKPSLGTPVSSASSTGTSLQATSSVEAPEKRTQLKPFGSAEDASQLSGRIRRTGEEPTPNPASIEQNELYCLAVDDHGIVILSGSSLKLIKQIPICFSLPERLTLIALNEEPLRNGQHRLAATTASAHTTVGEPYVSCGSHDNTRTGERKERAYTVDALDERYPRYRHDCPDCQYLGCEFVASRRYDLYYCTRRSEPFLVARFSDTGWAAREYRLAESFHLYCSDYALARAAQAAREQGLAPAIGLAEPVSGGKKNLRRVLAQFPSDFFSLEGLASRRDAYSELPPLSETRVAYVGEIEDATALAALARDEGAAPVETGMYIIVPKAFPSPCTIRLGKQGYFACAEIAGVEHSFIVWPAPTVREAEARYESRGVQGSRTEEA